MNAHVKPEYARPEAMVLDRLVGMVMARLPAELAAAAARCDPRILEAYASARRAEDLRASELAVRDAAITELARLGLSASEIAREMDRYAGNGWLRDRLSKHMPARYIGRPAAHLWLAFKCHPFPLKRARITQIIENVESGCYSPAVWSDRSPTYRRPDMEVDDGN